MGSYGPVRVYVSTMASADSLVSWNTSEPFERIYLQVPTMTSATAFDLYAATDSSATYYQVRHMPPASSSVQAASFIVSAVGNGALVPLPGGFQFYRLKATDSAPTAATTFKLICSD